MQKDEYLLCSWDYNCAEYCAYGTGKECMAYFVHPETQTCQFGRIVSHSDFLPETLGDLTVWAVQSKIEKRSIEGKSMQAIHIWHTWKRKKTFSSHKHFILMCFPKISIFLHLICTHSMSGKAKLSCLVLNPPR